MSTATYDVVVDDFAAVRLGPPRTAHLLGKTYTLPPQVDPLSLNAEAQQAAAIASLSEKDQEDARRFRLRTLAIFWFTYRRGFPPIECECVCV